MGAVGGYQRRVAVQVILVACAAYLGHGVGFAVAVSKVQVVACGYVAASNGLRFLQRVAHNVVRHLQGVVHRVAASSGGRNESAQIVVGVRVAECAAQISALWSGSVFYRENIVYLVVGVAYFIAYFVHIQITGFPYLIAFYAM